MFDFKKILKYFLFLLVLGIIAGGLLAAVNSFTSPIIKEMEEAKLQAELKEIFGQDQKFPSIKDKPAQTSKYITDMYKWNDNNDVQKGVVYKVTTQGYGGDVTIVIAFSITDNKVMGFSVIDVSKETPGYGQNATTHNFQVTDQVAGSVSINPISGATVTSTAIKKAIEEASKNFLANKQILVGGVN